MAGSSAASVAIRSSWRAVRSSSIGIAGLHGRVGMEQPGEPLAHPGPFAVENAKPGRVAVAALDDVVGVLDAFEGEAEALGGPSRPFVEGVAFRSTRR